MSEPEVDVDDLPDRAGTPGPIGTRLDRWWGRVLATPRNKRIWNWGAPAAVTVLAAILRLWHLGYPHALVFDETYYVKDAWTLSHLGYEGTWSSNADTYFNAGDATHWTSAPEFVAHPPLGKWLISIGEHLTGIDDSVGWRLTTAVIGILAVVVVMLIAKHLFHGSTLLATIAGLLMAVDGSAIVMSRVSLLDNIVMFFALLGVWAMLLDRGYRDRRLLLTGSERLAGSERLSGNVRLTGSQRLSGNVRLTGSQRLSGNVRLTSSQHLTGSERAAGAADAAWQPGRRPVLWRPWLLVAGLLFGIDAGVKWSGFYFLAVFAIYSVLSDWFAYRKAGVLRTTEGVVQTIVTFVTMVPIAFAAYIMAWLGWLVTSGGWDRHWVESNPGQNAWHGLLSWVPYWAQNLWHYNVELYNYSINLHVHHPYQSNPLGWTLMLRPTSMYYVGSATGKNGCTAGGNGCASAITDLGNPLIWWAATLALLGLIYVFARYRDWRAGLLLTAIGAGWLPWVILYHGRTIFTFYAIAFEPYLILGLVYVIAIALGRATDSSDRRRRGIVVVASYLALVCAASVFFWPLWTGEQTSYSYWYAHMWLKSWI